MRLKTNIGSTRPSQLLEQWFAPETMTLAGLLSMDFGRIPSYPSQYWHRLCHVSKDMVINSISLPFDKEVDLQGISSAPQ